jgi:uncharacterized protein YcbX
VSLPERIGTLRVLRRYPVKSMAGENLERVFVSYAGLVGDRAYAFVDNANKTNFPWMTGRQGHEMILYQPRYVDPPEVNDLRPEADRFQAEVVSPEGGRFNVTDAALQKHLETRFGRSLSFRFSERAMTDARPVSIFGRAAVRALSGETGIELDDRRFRANFYVDWESGDPFFENSLVGKTIQIGSEVSVHVVKRDGRCVMITLDPQTAQASPEVLRNIVQKHEGCAGVYGAVLREGIVQVNDLVYAV